MQGPHNSIKKQVILKKSKLLFYLTFYEKRIIHGGQRLLISFYYQYPGPALNDEI